MLSTVEYLTREAAEKFGSGNSEKIERYVQHYIEQLGREPVEVACRYCDAEGCPHRNCFRRYPLNMGGLGLCGRL